MADPGRPIKTRPLDLFYVKIPEGESYSPLTFYNLVPANGAQPDRDLQLKGLSLTVLNFFAGDLPGEDDWDANIFRTLASIVPRFRKRADESRRTNEAYLKLRVAYWKAVVNEEKTETGEAKTTRSLEGPYYADQAFQFVVDDNTRAGGFSDRQVFDDILIRDALKLHMFLQELDEFDKDTAPYADVLKDTGLDAVVSLSGPWASVAPIVSGIVKNIAKLNKSDTVFDQEFTITTTDALGQSKLREGIYVALETLPPVKATDEALQDTPPLTFKNNAVYGQGQDNQPVRWTQSYLVFNLYRTPQVEFVGSAAEYLKDRNIEVPKESMKELSGAQMLILR